MKILTSKNGIALVAVLTVLLILTLLLPAMFTMTEAATKSSVKAQTEQQASYFARTSAEMAVMAFEEFYDSYEAELSKYNELLENGQNPEKHAVITNYETFMNNKSMKANRIYVYRNDFYVGRDIPPVVEYEGDGFAEWQAYEKEAIIYKAVKAEESVPDLSGSGYTQIGYADCSIAYEHVADYFSVKKDGSMELLVPEKDENGNVVTPEQQYNNIKNNYVPGSNGDTCQKIEREQIKFTAVATIDGKTYNAFSRSCLVVLPTKPTENNWLAPTEVEGNQIFADTDRATGIFELSYDDSFTGKGGGGGSANAIKQVLYSFSSSGNMIISTKGMESTADYNIEDLSLGVRPVTATKNPANDPHFGCLATNNMRSWATGVQKDNFIMFSSTNGIQVEMPVNLLVNPCRTGRIGDGLQANQTLYKLLVFQAPNITFQSSVNSMVSLWRKGGLGEILMDQLFGDGYDARRVTSLILSAPENTPYSYPNEDRGNKVVKAGKVCFMEDAYIWIIPVTENGSNYKTQSVYYKGSDIQLHKIAEAGDVYYFNSEVPTQQGNNTTGFSLSAYYMDVIYPTTVEDEVDEAGWNIWKKIQAAGYGFAQKTYAPAEYKEKDFLKIGNIYTDEGVEVEQVDDIFVVWES